MSFSMKHNRWQINSAKEKHLEEALSWNYGPMRPALELDISHYTVGFNRRWERITIKLLLWTLAISWHSIHEELWVVGSARVICFDCEPIKFNAAAVATGDRLLPTQEMMSLKESMLSSVNALDWESDRLGLSSQICELCDKLGIFWTFSLFTCEIWK